MDVELPSREHLLDIVERYVTLIEGGVSDRDANAMIGELDEMVPHANISDLIFWGEQERTHEEIVDESLIREHIWNEVGELGLLLHIRAQMEAVDKDDSAKFVYKNYASQMLTELDEKIKVLQSGTRH